MPEIAKANVNTPSPTWGKLEAKRERPRDLMLGLDRLRSHEVAAKYLPRNPTEAIVTVPGIGQVDPWRTRVDCARLKNMFAEAVDDSTGRIFVKPPEIAEDTPPQIETFLDDVDGRGSDLETFAKGECATAIAEGISFVLVDYPETAPGVERTAEEEVRAKLSPFWRHYSPASVIDWEFRPYGSAQRLIYVRLRECIHERTGPWTRERRDQVRVLYAGNPGALPDSAERYARWEVWRPVKPEQNDGEWQIQSFGSMRPQVDIPLIDFASDQTMPFEATPPFSDLAHLTIAHYRKLSNLDNAQTAAGFPIFHWAGGEIDPATKQPVGIGPNRFLVSPKESAHAEFVEPQGTSWASIRAELDAMERDGREKAAAPLQSEGTGTLTAMGEAIRSARASSKLASWALSFENALDRLLYYTATYMGLIEYRADSGWGGVKLNRKFVPTQRNSDGARLAHDRNLAGKLSDETTFDALQASEIVPEAVTWEIEQERLATEGPLAPPAGAADPFSETPPPQEKPPMPVPSKDPGMVA